MNTKHTQGNWEIGKGNIIYSDSKPIADVFGKYGSRKEEAEANAKLIAAAPALLKAAQFAANELGIWAMSCPNDESTQNALQVLLDAINKATE